VGTIPNAYTIKETPSSGQGAKGAKPPRGAKGANPTGAPSPGKERCPGCQPRLPATSCCYVVGLPGYDGS
jgi:hypothetical protein